MVDTVDRATRSKMMGRIRATNTAPEIAVRRFLHRAGLRFRLHVGQLPGKPDIVLSKYNTVVFVHGCFWHQHRGCRYATTPKSNTAFWKAKLNGNVRRDRVQLGRLRRMGWRVCVVWECDLSDRRLARLVVDIRAVRRTQPTACSDSSDPSE